jgi:hypothetical protein
MWSATDVIYVKSFYFEVRWSEVKWSEVKWSEVKWSEVKWSEVKWVTVNPGDKSAMYIRVTLYWGYLYCDYFIWCVTFTVAVLTCFVVCGCVYVWVL